jgi:hypothetical protein
MGNFSTVEECAVSKKCSDQYLRDKSSNISVGTNIGESVGTNIGASVDASEGASEGASVGASVGASKSGGASVGASKIGGASGAIMSTDISIIEPDISIIEPSLRKDIIEDSIRIAREILSLKFSDRPILYVCLGASPAYVYSALSAFITKSGSPNIAIEIPISGMTRVYSDEYTIPNDLKLTAFYNYINPFISPYKAYQMVLIDHCHTCISVNAFIDLLRQTHIYMESISYINLVDTVMSNGWIHPPRHVNVYHVIRSDTLNKISGHTGVPRAVPQYSFWHDLGNPVNYSTISPIAHKLRKDIISTVMHL